MKRKYRYRAACDGPEIRIAAFRLDNDLVEITPIRPHHGAEYRQALADALAETCCCNLWYLQIRGRSGATQSADARNKNIALECVFDR